MKKLAYHPWRKIPLIIVIALTFVNFSSLFRAYREALIQIRTNVILEPGTEFADFKDKISGAKIVGFLTDKDMSSERNDGQFLGAQYMLAPMILDLNNPYHEFLILDYIDLSYSFEKIKELNAIYLYTNKYGKSLAKKKL